MATQTVVGNTLRFQVCRTLENGKLHRPSKCFEAQTKRVKNSEAKKYKQEVEGKGPDEMVNVLVLSKQTEVDKNLWIASEMKVSSAVLSAPRPLLNDAWNRYNNEILEGSAGDQRIFARIKAHKSFETDRPLDVITTAECQQWIDDRLATGITEGAVRREFNVLSGFFTQCGLVRNKINKRPVWKLMQVNPLADVTPLSDNPAKDIIIAPEELAAFVAACETDEEKRVGAALSFACDMGVRLGEMVQIKPIHRRGQFELFLPKCKSHSRKKPKNRTISMTVEAMAFLPASGDFNLTEERVGKIMRRITAKIGADFTFHCARHTAATKWGKVLDVFELCEMFGWSDINMARRYVQTVAASIGAKMRQARVNGDC